jgi:hypothetical protein
MRVSCCFWYLNFLRSGMTAEPLAVQVFTERDNEDDCLHFRVVFALAVLLSLHKCCQVVMLKLKKTKLNSVAFSPQANYTDRATSACRQS